MSNIKIRALSKGFYLDSQVDAGQVFELRPIVVNRLKPGTTKVYEKISLSAEDQFSDEWMEKIEEEAEAPAPSAQADNTANPGNAAPAGDLSGDNGGEI